MLNEDTPTLGLSGSYRDVMRGPDGQITWDSGWKKNQIVIDCRRLIAAFMRGQANTLGIQGLQVGAGDSTWDRTGPPSPQPTDTALMDPQPYLVPVAALKLEYLDPATGAPSAPPTRPTQRLQIVATLGPRVPNWPDPTEQPPSPLHAMATLREFGLVGQLDGKPVLINAVRHVAIVKDPLSTLVRTIQLAF
jgi:hypothetical protein